MEQVRAYEYKHLAAAGIKTENYTPMHEAGTFQGVLNAKAWGRCNNMILYITLMGGRNIIAVVWHNGSTDGRPDYLGADSIPMGSTVELVFETVKTGKIKLANWKVLSACAQ